MYLRTSTSILPAICAIVLTACLMLLALGVGVGAGLVKTLFTLGQLLSQLLIFALQLLDAVDRCLDSVVELLKSLKSHSRCFFHFQFNFRLIKLSSRIRTAGSFRT